MLDYRGGDMERSDPAPAARAASFLRHVSAATILRAAMRRKTTVAMVALLGAVVSFGVTKALTPRYVATAQIYLDPRALPGLEKEDAGRQDSTGYINFVETQARLMTSQVVLDRVVVKEKLAVDPEFGGGAAGGLLSRLFAHRPAADEADDSLAAARSLGKQIVIRRPERTFIIEISATSSSATKAARIANAVAQAYIDTRSAIQSDSAQQATASFGARLENLHDRLISAERKVENYKIDNGLVGARDQYVDEQSLKELNQQLSYARARLDDARAKYDQFRRARHSDTDLGNLVATLNVATLTNLRAQQALALERVAELSSELGPRHPSVINARARSAEMRRLLDAELARVGASVRKDFEEAQDVEAGLRRDVDRLRDKAGDNAQASVKLRDLEREVEVSRAVYQSFLTRSRQTAEAQSLDPTSTHIVTRATPPNARAFPPGAGLMSALALICGAVCGVALAFLQESRGGPLLAPSRAPSQLMRARENDEENMPSPAQARPVRLEPARLAIGASTVFQVAYPPKFGGAPALTRLGIPVAQRGETTSEVEAFVQRFAESADIARRQIVAVVGAMTNEARTIVAVNLAIAFNAQGFKPALVDADERNGVLTSFVDTTGETLNERSGCIQDATDGAVFAMPSRVDGKSFRSSARALIRELQHPESDVDIILCDGAFSDPDLAAIVDWTILVLDDVAQEAWESESLPEPVADTIALVLRFEHPDPWCETAQELRAIA